MTYPQPDAGQSRPRFDGGEAFRHLPADMQLRIGKIALELVVAWIGQDHNRRGGKARPFDAADMLLIALLESTVCEAVRPPPTNEPFPLPSLLGKVCRDCGCSEYDACQSDNNDDFRTACAWAEDDLCTSCAEGEA